MRKLEKEIEYRRCRTCDRQIHLIDWNQVAPEMDQSGLRQRTISPADRTCRFKLNDLVRIDFVFPYGRVAVNRDGLTPEPFDRDAEYSVSAGEMEEIRESVRHLFRTTSQ